MGCCCCCCEVPLSTSPPAVASASLADASTSDASGSELWDALTRICCCCCRPLRRAARLPLLGFKLHCWLSSLEVLAAAAAAADADVALLPCGGSCCTSCCRGCCCWASRCRLACVLRRTDSWINSSAAHMQKQPKSPNSLSTFGVQPNTLSLDADFGHDAAQLWIGCRCSGVTGTSATYGTHAEASQRTYAQAHQLLHRHPARILLNLLLQHCT